MNYYPFDANLIYVPGSSPQPVYLPAALARPRTPWHAGTQLFTLKCSYMRTICTCVRNLTRRALSMFNPTLCGLTGKSKTGAGCFGACWSGTGATTARSGGERAWSGLPAATSPTSTLATSSRVASGSRASGRSTPSAGRWAYHSRPGSKKTRNVGDFDLPPVVSVRPAPPLPTSANSPDAAPHRHAYSLRRGNEAPA